MQERNQFSKYAKEYKSYNIIQQICAKSLVRELKTKPKNILELGCGSGQVFSNIDWDFDKYLAIDGAENMCKLHPKHSKLEVVCLNFDSNEFFQKIKNSNFDTVLSSSALQWSKDLKKIIFELSKITKEINAVLFTSNTFKTIQNITNQKSPILSEENIFSELFYTNMMRENFKEITSDFKKMVKRLTKSKKSDPDKDSGFDDFNDFE